MKAFITSLQQKKHNGEQVYCSAIPLSFLHFCLSMCELVFESLQANDEMILLQKDCDQAT